MPPVNDIAADPLARDLRERIAAVDLAILAAVNARIALVAELWRHKQARGYAQVDRAREASMLELLARENPGPLTAGGLEDFSAALVELTKREVSATKSPPA
jgi:chorismate mutase